MCENTNNDSCRCIAEILSIINILQHKADCNEACLETCDRGFLGCSPSSINCNTRPVMLYTCCGNGTPWVVPKSDKIVRHILTYIFFKEANTRLFVFNCIKK